tara:strand:+ start:131 stop:562 length:432 start_codon:yes stop_codon:yes gene_type:complete
MFLKTHSSTDRLKIWRESRQQEYSTPEQLVNQYSDIKILSRYLDYYTPNSWPNPFEIVSEGYFCQSGITILITASLINKGFITSEQLTLPVISNNISGDSGLVLLDNDKVFNFTPGKIVTWDYVKENATIFQTHILNIDKLSY